MYREEREEAELQLSKQVFNLLAGSSSQQPHRQTRTTGRLAQQDGTGSAPSGTEEEKIETAEESFQLDDKDNNAVPFSLIFLFFFFFFFSAAFIKSTK